MKLSPILLAVRAVSAEFAQRLFLPVVFIVGGALLILLIVAIWLVTLSAWWWLLLAPLILITVIAIFAAALTRVAIVFLRPYQTIEQRRTVRGFVDALQEGSETIQTPKFMLLFFVVRDVLFPSKQSYISKVSSNAVSLQRGLKETIASFQDSSR